MAKITSLLLAFAIVGAVYSAPSGDTDGDDRILHGKAAKKNAYPFVVSLQYKMPSEPGTILRSKFCGGSIVNKQWIVTAAHCVNSPDPEGEMHIKAGELNAFTLEGQYPRVEKIIIAPGYNKTGHEEHDIALLKLAEPLKFSASVQPIALPPQDHIPKGSGMIIGWGAINEDHSKSSNDLLEVAMKTSETDACRIFALYNPKQQICLESDKKHVGSACGGDSGGPYFMSVGGKPMLAGVTSFGTVKCTADKPVVYTNVGAYMNFIKEAMAKF